MMAINLPERCYCADVDYPMAIVGTAGRGLIVYSLENKPTEYKRQESPLKYQHRTVAIFKDKKKTPAGKNSRWLWASERAMFKFRRNNFSSADGLRSG